MEILKSNFKIIKKQKMLFFVNFIIWFFIHSIPLLIALFIKNLVYSIEIQDIYSYKIMVSFIVLVAFIQSYLIIKGGEIDTKFRFKIRQLIRKKLLFLTISKNKISQKDKSEILEIMTTDVYAVEEVISSYIDLLCKIIFIFFSFIILAIINIKIIVILVIPMIIINYLVLKLQNIIKNRHFNVRNEKIKYTNFVKQLLSTREEIRQDIIKNNVSNVFNKILNSTKKEELKNNIITSILAEIPSFLDNINTILIIIFFIAEFSKNSLNIGDFYLLVSLSSYIAMCTTLFTEILAGTKYFENFLFRVKNIFSIDNFINYNKKDFNKENIFIENEFDKLTVENVKIKDKFISFELNRGEMLVITGNVGSGKTALIEKIILNNCDENIFYNKIHIKSIDKNKIFSYANQEINFLNESIFENICLDNENIDYIKCLKIANLYNEFKNIDLKQYKIGENGSKLSEGQKQRLAIACAVANYKKILILDDSFSLIDEKNRIDIINNLKKEKFTSIIVSNDLNIIGLADKVLKV